MTNEKIIALILTSSVLSSVLTVLVQYFFKFLDYRLDYKKKIIDKRINAYENVGSITWQLAFITQDGEMAWSGIFTSEKDFDNFLVNLTLARKDQIWLSQELTKKFTELNAFLINLQNDHTPVDERDYNKLGNENFSIIRKFREEIESIYKNDFRNLDKVDRFLDKKSDSKTKFDIRKKNSIN